MRVHYTYHALKRMDARERNISKEEVELTLANPDILRPGKAGARIADKTTGGRRISVVYKQEDDALIVLTVVAL